MPRFDKKTISIDEELVKWVESMIETKEFANFSHAVQKALYQLKESYETK